MLVLLLLMIYHLNYFLPKDLKKVNRILEASGAHHTFRKQTPNGHGDIEEN